MALVGYYVGIYLLLYLSRTREYLADAFSANRIEPRQSGQRADQDRLRHRPIEDTDATGEDVIFQDKTGLMAVDFRSMLGLIGNLFAGWKRVPKHLTEPGEASGWFRRGMGGYLILRELKTTVGSLRAKPFFWQVVLCLIVIIGSVFLV